MKKTGTRTHIGRLLGMAGVVLLACSVLSHAAISVTELGNYIYTGGNTTSSTWDPATGLPLGANGMVILMITWEGTSTATLSPTLVTYDGQNMTQATGKSQRGAGAWIYYLANPTEANGEFSVTVSGTFKGFKLAALYATGLQGVGNTATAGQNVTNPADPLSAGPITVTVGSLLVDAAAEHYGRGFTAASGVGTIVLNDSSDGYTGGASYGTADSASESTTWIGDTSVDPNVGDFALALASFAPAPEPDIAVLDDGGTPIANGATWGTDFTFNSAKTFTVTNSGSGTLLLSNDPAVTLGGDHPDSFQITDNITGAATSIGGGAIAPFTIALTNAVLGTYTSTVSIANNVAGEDPYEFDITGTVISTPLISVYNEGSEIANGGSTDFGTLLVDVTNTLVFAVTNFGNAALSLSGTPAIAIEGDTEFTVSTNITGGATSIAAGESELFAVEFSAASAGSYSATVSITNNSSVTPFEFDVTATVYTTAIPVKHSMQITFTNVTGTLTDFPALVKLTTNTTDNYDGFDELADGYDLRFWTNDTLTGTELDYEIESFDSTSNSFIWVQVPSLSQDTSIWASWGDTAQNSQQAYTTNGAVWDGGYAGVWHLDETNSVEDLRDSTSNGNDGTDNGTENTASVIASGQSFTKADEDYIDCGNDASLEITGNLTLSVWAKLDTTSGNYALLSKRVSANGYELLVKTGSTTISLLGDNNAAATGITWDTNTWHHYAVTAAGTVVQIYYDGQPATMSDGYAEISSDSTPLLLGKRPDNTSVIFPGLLDEPRVSSVVRSANWIKASYLNQGTSTFVEYGDATAVYAPEMSVFQGSTEIIHDVGTNDFGNIAVDVTNTLVFAVTNSGNAALSLSGTPAIAISGDTEFTVGTNITGGATTVAAGGSELFAIEFSAASAGSYTATVSIANNSDVSPYEFDVTATVVATPFPEMAVYGAGQEITDGATVAQVSDDTDFQSVTYGQSLERQFVITNSVTAVPTNLYLTDGLPTPVTISGDSAFTISTNAPTTNLAAGASTTFWVKFDPPANVDNTYTATVSIANNDLDENPYTFLVEGDSTASFSLTGGGDHLGLDWVPSSGDEIGGVHYNIDTFTVPVGSVTVEALNQLVVTAATITVTGTLSADEAGYADDASSTGQGTDQNGGTKKGGGGAGYGGTGGDGSSGSSPVGGGVAWGNPDIATEETFPDEFGSGGGSTIDAYGGTGGGAIKLVATGTLTVGGTISADGGNGQSNTGDKSAGGGGAGGSIWLQCNSLAGSGTVTANGGNGGYGGEAIRGIGGGGGGGRIAMYYYLGTMNLTTNVLGGATGYDNGVATGGAAGSLYVARPEMQVYRGGTAVADGGTYDFGTQFASTPDEQVFTITNAGDLAFSLTADPAITRTGDTTEFTITTNVTGSPSIGAGVSTNFAITFEASAAGSYTAAVSIAASVGSYDFEVTAEVLGAGQPEMAVFGEGQEITSGAGTAQGSDGTDFGSVTYLLSQEQMFVITNLPAATGELILTDGLPNPVTISGDSAFTISTNAPTTNIAAGASTTFWVKFEPPVNMAATYTATVSIANSDANENPYTFLVEGDSAATFSATGGGDHLGDDWSPNSGDEIGGVHANIGTFTVPAGPPVTVQAGTPLVVTAATITVTGTLSADEAGYAHDDVSDGQGVDVGGGTHKGGGGGGYGGAGGDGSSSGGTVGGGGAWGDPDIATEETFPDEFGSGGGSAVVAYGGTGGGAIKLVAAGTLTVEGTISANGGEGQSRDVSGDKSGGGGGAGGSIWLQCNRLAGSGTVTAYGGDGGYGNDPARGIGGGGGGGRIAMYFRSGSTNDLTTISVAGGSRGYALDTIATDGALGTFYVEGAPTGTLFLFQ
jgi:hypothetical protein